MPRLSLPRAVAFLSALFAAARLFAANPIVPAVGLTDPYGIAYGDRVYIYATHDASPKSRGYVMNDWWAWSSANLLDWKEECVLKPQDTFIGKPYASCWATSSCCKNGKYYWYFSAGRDQIGVMVADSPAGPWEDPLKKPLIPKGLTPTVERDPTVFIDDDGKEYLVFGTFNYFIADLNDDMISLARPPQAVRIDHPFGPYGEGKTDDKPSLHKRNGIYYLSWSSFYAVSRNVHGPFTYKGSVIDKALVAPEFQNSHLFRDRHGNFFEFNHQWYYACNDYSQPGRSGYFRDAILSYVHYRDNGDVAPVRIDGIGVGEYDAASPRIEAEDYFNETGADVRECLAGGFEVRGLTAASSLYYPHVRNLRANTSMVFSAASGGAGGDIEVHEGSPGGSLLGICHITPTGGWGVYKSFACRLNNQAGKTDLCLVFKGGAGELARLDWFGFPASPLSKD